MDDPETGKLANDKIVSQSSVVISSESLIKFGEAIRKFEMDPLINNQSLFIRNLLGFWNDIVSDASYSKAIEGAAVNVDRQNIRGIQVNLEKIQKKNLADVSGLMSAFEAVAKESGIRIASGKVTKVGLRGKIAENFISIKMIDWDALQGYAKIALGVYPDDPDLNALNSIIDDVTIFRTRDKVRIPKDDYQSIVNLSSAIKRSGTNIGLDALLNIVKSIESVNSR